MEAIVINTLFCAIVFLFIALGCICFVTAKELGEEKYEHAKTRLVLDRERSEHAKTKKNWK